MAIQNDNTLVTKGDLKNLYTDKIAPYLGGGISYYQCDRTGEELKSCYAKLASSWSATANTNVPFVIQSGNIAQPSTGLFTIPNGMRVEMIFSSSAYPGGDTSYNYYNNTDSVNLPLAYIDPYMISNYTNSTVLCGQWTNNTGHNVNISVRCTDTNGSTTLQVNLASFSIKEIGRIVDPVKYVDNNSDLEETPVGNIISYMGNSIPKHYLACNGAPYQIGTYPELEAFIINEFGSINYFGGDGVNTWAVPDLRGEFLRGAGTNSHINQGNGANVGVHQDGTKHNVVYSYNNGSIGIFGAGGYDAANTDATNPDAIQQAYTANQSVSTNNNGNATTDHTYTSRPTNTSVKYCIKCESTFHAFFANAAYKVETSLSDGGAKTWNNYGGDNSGQICTPTLIEGDSSLINATNKCFIVPIDGWYSISAIVPYSQKTPSNKSGWIMFFDISDNNKKIGLTNTLQSDNTANTVSADGEWGHMYCSGTFYLEKGHQIQIGAQRSANDLNFTNAKASFCLLTSNYNPTIVCASDVYSENEQMIGYQKNGKPLYQKTIVTQTPSTTADATVGNLPTNLDQLVSMFGFVETTTHGHLPIISYAESSYNIYTQARPGDGTITTRVSYSGQCSKPEYITIQYTKTTDTANSLEVENSLLLNRPDLWTAGTEYNFGGGLYGIRKTGTITATADERVQTAIITVTGGNTPNIINSGGWIKWGDEGTNDYKYPINSTMTGLTGWGTIEGAQSVMRTSNTQIALQNTSGLARTNQAYDVQVLYTK